MKRAALTYRFNNEVGPYADALRSVGVQPVLVDPAGATPTLDDIEGLLLSGGTDVNPTLYGHARDPRSEDPDDELDALEQSLLQQALARDIPVLAICRGLQLFNVAHAGGTLVQHIEGHSVRGDDLSIPAHTVLVEGGTMLSRIMGAGEHRVNSRHHQAALDIGSGLVVSARAADGVVEAMELPGKKFAVAVQWHPENQVYSFSEQRRLFEAFRDAL
jgi:putative glutamine amidotransferase